MRWPGSGRPAQRRYPGNELALELIVKYQQNPLCAARALAHMHVAANDAIVELAATSSGEAAQAVAAQTVAVHVASAALLAHFYPRESPGRIEALGIGAMLAVAAKSGISPEALAAARQEGHRTASAAIRRALDDGGDATWNPADRPAAAAPVWRAAPPLNLYQPTEPPAGRWRTRALTDGGEIAPPPPPPYGGDRRRGSLPSGDTSRSNQGQYRQPYRQTGRRSGRGDHHLAMA